MGIEPERPPPTFIQRILAKYSYSQKFQVIALLVSFLTILITYLLVSTQLREFSFAEMEIKGNEYQSKVHQLIEKMSKHRIYSNRFLQGDESNRGELAQTQNELNVGFSELLTLTNTLEDDLYLGTSDLKIHEKSNIAPNQIYTNWKEYTSSMNRTSVEANNLFHTNIINNFQDLLRYVGDSSNMAYDREVETHYLMESSLRSLPEEQELITTLLTKSENVIKRGNLNQEEEFLLSTYISLLLASVQNTEESIQKSIIEDANVNQRLETKDRLSDPLIDYREAVTDFANFVKQTFLIYQNNDPDSLKRLFSSETLSELRFLGEAALSKNNQLWNTLTQQIDLLLNWRISDIRLKGYFIICFVMLVLGFAIFLGWQIVKETNYFFREVHRAITRFSNGELSARAPVAYDKAFETMRGVLNSLGDTIEHLVDQLHKSGVQLTTTTTQIAAAAKHQEGTVCQQEATVKQILVTAGEISSTARDFAKTMNEVSDSAEETSKLASSGKAGLTEMEASMHQMVKASKNISSKLAVLSEKAGAITSVITTITKVADQTNLLALNAAIEAEKAGEHGKSFAVIAREIRRLAEQTANATDDIEKMITEMMSAVSEGVMGVDKFSVEIRTGAEHVSTVSEQLTQIIERVQQQTVSYENVNKGVQAQSLGAEQINESIMQLSDAAQETTNSIRQFHTAIEQLNISTKEMQKSVARLKK